MRGSTTSKVIVLLAVIFISACKTKKAAVTPSVPVIAVEKPALTREDVLRNISAKQTVFNTLSLKAKAELLIDGKDNNVTLNIRMQKDKVIWVSASIGIEIARILITPDSLKMFSRVRDIYVSEPFSYIHRYANKQIDFAALQSLLIGNYMPGFAGQNAKVEFKNNQASLEGLLSGISYLIQFNPANKVSKTNLKDEETRRNLTVNYSDFTEVNEQILPGTVKISSEIGAKRAEINLNYSQLSLNQSLEFPFSIPRKYTNKN